MNVAVREMLLLSCVPGVGANRLRTLVGHFGGAGEVLEASPRSLVAIAGMDKKTALAIAGFRHSDAYPGAERFAAGQMARLARAKARVVTFWDDDYPANLKRIFDPPPFLFVRGKLDAADERGIAVVGTRAATPYGIHMAERLSTEFARLGIPVISGLARGIDTAAHTATIAASGRTVAVIGSGVDVIYPSDNRQLAERIIATGMLVSEYEMGAKPDAVNFPKRNRIISGMSLGTVVVETGIDGGAMITATIALDQNREVFAVPSAVCDRRESGTNRLIKEGKAVLTESIDDVLAELAPRFRGLLRRTGGVSPPPPPPSNLSLFETRLMDVLGDAPLHIDMIASRSGLSTADALVHLLSLEFKGLVRQRPGKMFLRA